MSPATALPWLLLLLGACSESVAWSRGRDLSADTWQAAGGEWRGWLRNKLHGDDGYGHGYCYGYGNGDGNGYGHGYGHGDGYGDGDGEGVGYGDGYGDGNGYGYGYGNGHGSGSGSGNIYVYDYSYGDGSGYSEQIWLDVVTLEFDGTRLDGDIRAAVIELIGARLAEIEA